MVSQIDVEHKISSYLIHGGGDESNPNYAQILKLQGEDI